MQGNLNYDVPMGCTVWVEELTGEDEIAKMTAVATPHHSMWDSASDEEDDEEAPQNVIVARMPEVPPPSAEDLDVLCRYLGGMTVGDGEGGCTVPGCPGGQLVSIEGIPFCGREHALVSLRMAGGRPDLIAQVERSTGWTEGPLYTDEDVAEEEGGYKRRRG